MPKRADEAPVTHPIQVVLSADQKKKAAREAHREGLSLSAYVRRLIVVAVEGAQPMPAGRVPVP
jgi:hypothetical protein